MKKLLALILCLTLAVSVFAGCGGGGGLEAAGEGNEGPVATMDQQEIPEDLTLTIGIPLSASVEDYDTNAYTLWLEEQTGYDLEFITFQSSSTDYKAQLSTMLATGDELPDILWNFQVGQGAYEEYGASGYFIDMAPYYNDKEVSKIRNQKIGFVFQTYNLVARTSALKNVELPMMYAGVPKRERTKRAKELLKLVGMEERMNHTPDELSGGQKQRVAIARALGNHPAIILPDEPTGALDSKTGRMIMDLFHKLNRENGITIVLITHSNELAEETQRIVTLKDGEIIGERKGEAYAV